MDSLIEIKDVTAGYGRKVAIENITLSIKKEEFVGIIGPNGSGKTTLLKVIMGTLKPFKGSVSVLGTSPEKILKKIGFVPQFFNDDPFQPFITLEVVLFGLYPVLGPFKRVRKKETEMCMEALRQVGMEEMAREPFGHLSGGQMRRVMIARAIVSKPEILILDEPHNIQGWELFVNRLRRTKKVIVTGSNSKMLSGELATHLTGRHIDFTLYPFSFREFLTYNDFELGEYLTATKMGLIKNLLKEYMVQGGFPERYLLGKEMLVNIYFDIIEKDIIKRIKIKKRVAFKEMAKYLISNFSSEITFSKLKNILNIKDQHTIKNWVDGLEQAYLIKVIERYSPKLKESIIAPKKVYCIDTGIISAISFRFSENTGRIMENMVAIELLRRRSYWHPNTEIFYWKDHQGREVDFVIKEGMDVKQLVQVSYASAIDEIERREIKALMKASDMLHCKNMLLITWDYEDEIKKNGKMIKAIPLWKWLLE